MLLDEMSPSSGDVLLFGAKVTGSGVVRYRAVRDRQEQPAQPVVSQPVGAPEPAHRGAGTPPRTVAARSVAGRQPARGREQVGSVLALLDLVKRADAGAILAYGEKRRLEIGMALATSPNVLLLDEPLAGMSPAERTATCVLIRDGVRSCTIVIVEHDLDAIFELAERIPSAAIRRPVACGRLPYEIRRNQRVQDAYLGGLDT